MNNDKLKIGDIVRVRNKYEFTEETEYEPCISLWHDKLGKINYVATYRKKPVYQISFLTEPEETDRLCFGKPVERYFWFEYELQKIDSMDMAGNVQNDAYSSLLGVDE